MPILTNPRSEAFAQACARGARMIDAYEDAGFAPGNRHAARLARRPEVGARIAELRAEQAHVLDAGGPAVIAGLLRIVEAGAELKTPAAMKEMRVTLLEAYRLAGEVARGRDADRRDSGLDELLLEEAKFVSMRGYNQRERAWEHEVA